MIVGNEIIVCLKNKLNEKQIGKSSHWEFYLKHFSYTENDGLKGLSGFGNVTARSIYNKIMHAVMQIPIKLFVRKKYRFNHLLMMGKKIAKTQNRALDMDMLRHVFTLALMENKIQKIKEKEKTCLVIGDGLGNMSSLLVLYGIKKIVSINLNEVLLTDYIFMKSILLPEQIAYVDSQNDLDIAINDKKIILIYLSADKHSLIRNLKIDFAFNIASMQEMNPEIVGEYFEDMRNSKSSDLFFYCCNRIDKTLPDGTKTGFFNYPWSYLDKIIIDELSPWNKYYYRVNPPHFRKYAGLVQHRLVKLNLYN